MYFPTVLLRQRFYDLILEMTADQEGMVTELDSEQLKVFSFLFSPENSDF